MEDDGQGPSLPLMLAAINRFRLVEELEPAFFQKHWLSIRVGTCVIDYWDDPNAQLLLGLAANNGLDQAAEAVLTVIANWPFDAERADQAAGQIQSCLRSLRKVCRDPELPDWLLGAKQIIDDSFIDPQ